MAGKTAKERAAERMARAANGSAQPATAESTVLDAAPQPQPAPVRTKPVRVTVDLSPVEHRTLTRLRGELAEAAGLATVAGADVFRALLEELEESERDGSASVFPGVAYRLIERGRGRA